MRTSLLVLVLVLAGCASAPPAATSSAIALANLDALIEQGASDTASVDLLLLRAQLLADDKALDRAVALTDTASTAPELLRRSRARAGVHRFADALADVDAAGREGAKVDALRASLWLATGRAGEALPALQAEADRQPGFGAHAALARGLAAVGRLEEADARYAQALAGLDTTSPFPAASLWFARGVMWAEQGGDAQRGRRMYAQALRLVPEFAVANVHMAELEVRAGETAAAIARLQRVVDRCNEPEALALLGTLHVKAGETQRGRGEIAAARSRFDALLARHPRAYADHAAEFFLGAGDDAERARFWARLNLSERGTRRAHQLAIRAAMATGRLDEAQALRVRMDERFPNEKAA